METGNSGNSLWKLWKLWNHCTLALACVRERGDLDLIDAAVVADREVVTLTFAARRALLHKFVKKLKRDDEEERKEGEALGTLGVVEYTTLTSAELLDARGSALFFEQDQVFVQVLGSVTQIGLLISDPYNWPLDIGLNSISRTHPNQPHDHE